MAPDYFAKFRNPNSKTFDMCIIAHQNSFDSLLVQLPPLLTWYMNEALSPKYLEMTEICLLLEPQLKWSLVILSRLAGTVDDIGRSVDCFGPQECWQPL